MYSHNGHSSMRAMARNPKAIIAPDQAFQNVTATKKDDRSFLTNVKIVDRLLCDSDTVKCSIRPLE